ncbi:MAG: glycosyltransferase family 39 protein [Candidatus Sulfotelmatobacter sp.]
MALSQARNEAPVDAAESWFRSRSNAAAVFVLFLGFLARLWAASGTFLNPDEALHFRLANQPSLYLAYKASLTASHPPLLTLLLYYWRAFGTSELWLRLLLVLASVVFCWVFYKWLSNAAGSLAGFIGLLFVALLPPIVLLSVDIRQYPLLLAFLAAALYLLDESFAKQSIARMAGFTLCLYLAMLSHYSAFLFAAALGIYAVLRIFRERPPARLALVWAIGQLGTLVLAIFLYKTHISKLGVGESRTALQGWMSEFFLRHSYFDPAHDNPLLFLIGHSFGVFQYFFGQLAVGDLAGILFIVGALLLLGKGFAYNQTSSRRLGIFLLLPFVVACGASLAHVYPYGGTRHIAFLMIPGVAGVGIAVDQLMDQRWFRAVGFAGLILALCIAFGKQRQPYMRRSDQSRTRMNEASDFLRERARSPEVVFTDYESDLMLGHYLCRQKPIAFQSSTPDFEVFSCDGVRIVSAGYKAATLFDGNHFFNSWDRLLETYQLKPGTIVWIFQAGWDVNLSEDLQRQYAEFRNLRIESFGNNIKIFKLTVGQPMPAVNSKSAAP